VLGVIARFCEVSFGEGAAGAGFQASLETTGRLFSPEFHGHNE
jgi:hypothetical protein